MKFSGFLKEKFISFIVVTCFIITVEIFLLILDDRIFLQLYVGIGGFLLYFFILGMEYMKRKQYYNDVFKSLESIDKKYLISEMNIRADFVEAKLLNEILREIGKSMTEHVNTYKYNQEEYKEYIELWIHEIKTPISVSQMIIENNQNEVTNSIDEELQKIDDFVEQALFYARSNHTEKDYIIKETLLTDLINPVILKNKKTFLSKKIKINIEEIDNLVYTDSKWMIFILNQIIGNSIKYSNSENPEIRIQSEKQKNKVELRIQDNGIGIREDELTKVFEKGFTGTNGRNYNRATGMGLYLCQKLCNKLGQDITIQSEEGKGTQVTITFPNNSYVQF